MVGVSHSRCASNRVTTRFTYSSSESRDPAAGMVYSSGACAEILAGVVVANDVHAVAFGGTGFTGYIF